MIDVAFSRAANVRPRRARPAHQRGASCQTRAERDDDEDRDRRDEGRPGHGEVGDAQQQAGDRCEREDQDEVIDRDLGEGVVGVAVGELAPHEHHRGAWGDPEQDHAGDVLVGFAAGTKSANTNRKNRYARPAIVNGLTSQLIVRVRTRPLGRWPTSLRQSGSTLSIIG